MKKIDLNIKKIKDIKTKGFSKVFNIDNNPDEKKINKKTDDVKKDTK